MAEDRQDRPRRTDVLGVPVDAVDMDGALTFITACVRQMTRPGYIMAVNPEKVRVARRDPELLACLRNATLLIPDGIGVVKAVRWLQGLRLARVAGADLFERLCQVSAAGSLRLFLYGATEEVNRGAVETLRARYPGIQIVGRANGYVADAEMADLVARINAAAPDILFVGLGSPRQERWISAHLPELQVRFCMGVGGTYDTVTGKVRRAPRWCQRLGVEWLYRLVRQPSRLLRQTSLPLFVCWVATAWLRQRSAGKRAGQATD